MQTATVLYIILAGTIAFLVAFFQYKYKAKSMQKTRMLLAFLRFATVFSLLLLLINPTITNTSFYTEKPTLVVAVDNSASISYLEKENDVIEILQRINTHEGLANRFTIKTYAFDNAITETDSLSFKSNQTNISQALRSLHNVYNGSTAPIVLLTDGNQTYGEDYEFSSRNLKQSVYPVIVGDTTRYKDLAITKLNTNRYAFLKNKFPVEVFVNYDGDDTVTTNFTILQDNNTVFSQRLTFSKDNSSHVINANLNANSIGVQTYRAIIAPLETELNKVNNAKPFAVEVIDERTSVLIVSDLQHPDVGALKRSIESNEQRTVTIATSTQAVNQLEEHQLVILYQPSSGFLQIFNQLNQLNKNYWVVTGTATNWRFLNANQQVFAKELNFQTEEYQSQLNTNYNTFQVNDIAFEDFPPLEGFLGSINFKKQANTLLYKSIKGIATEEPLLITTEVDNRRIATLFGEHLWKWRMQSFINNNSFEDFNTFIGKIVLYLASNKKRSRLSLDYDSFYYGNTQIKISASYFDTNFVFDPNASLQITLTNKDNNQQQTLPLLLKNNYYEVDVSSLSPGVYNFTVKVEGANISVSGNFTILEFNVEQQFLNANSNKLTTLATNTAGNVFTTQEVDTLIENLLANENYIPIQKSTQKTVSLVDWKYLLFFIVLLLALEWFIRKYNGLI